MHDTGKSQSMQMLQADGYDKHAPVASMSGVERKTKTPMRIKEEPTKVQAQILKAFGYAVKTGGVLQKLAR